MIYAVVWVAGLYVHYDMDGRRRWRGSTSHGDYVVVMPLEHRCIPWVPFLVFPSERSGRYALHTGPKRGLETRVVFDGRVVWSGIPESVNIFRSNIPRTVKAFVGEESVPLELTHGSRRHWGGLLYMTN